MPGSGCATGLTERGRMQVPLMSSKRKMFSRESRLAWGAEQKKKKQAKAKRITSAIEIIQRDGYYHRPGTPAYKNIPCYEELPEGAELFEWNKLNDQLSSIGKYVKVTKLDGTMVYAPIVKLSTKKTYIKTPLGMFGRKEYPDFVEKENIHQTDPDYAKKERDRLRKVADRFIVTGSIVDAIKEAYPKRTVKKLHRMVYQLSLSPMFKQMVSNKLKDALESQGITAEELVKLRVDLINLAKDQKDTKELNNAIKGLEAMFASAEETAREKRENKGLVEGPTAIDSLELDKLKSLRGERDDAQDAEIIEETNNP